MGDGVVFVDTETTGLDPDRNPVWEIAVIRDGVEHCWQVRLPTELSIVGDDEPPPSGPYMTEWVLENTGWRDRYDDDLALTPLDSIERFAELTEGRHLVGAVPSFDEERMRGLYRTWIDQRATRFPWHYHLIDVEALAVGHLGAAVPLPWKSDDLSRLLGVHPPEGSERHTALADARRAKAIYEAVTSSRPLVMEFFDTVRGDAGPDGVVKVRQFWWRVRHTSNGLIVGASSEGYSSRGARDDNAALLHPDLEPVEVDS